VGGISVNVLPNLGLPTSSFSSSTLGKLSFSLEGSYEGSLINPISTLSLEVKINFSQQMAVKAWPTYVVTDFFQSLFCNWVTNWASEFGRVGIRGKQVTKVPHIVGPLGGYGCPILELENP
jgi:hypothetical protein